MKRSLTVKTYGKIHLKRDNLRTWCGRIGVEHVGARVVDDKHKFLKIDPNGRCAACGMFRDWEEDRSRKRAIDAEVKRAAR